MAAPLTLPTGRLGTVLTRVRAGEIVVNRARYRGGERTPRHVHDRASICFVLAGEYEERWASRAETVGRGALVLKPARADHENLFRSAEVTCLNIDLDDATTDAVGAEVFRAPWALHEPRAARLARELDAELSTADRAARLAAEGLVLGLCAEVARAFDRRLDADDLAMDSVAEHLRAELAHAPSTRELAAGLGLHPVRLARRFRARFGCTVGDYLRRLRTERAMTALAETDRPIAELALELGFCDQSHLGRVFRRETGLTPAAFRAHARGRDRSSRRRSS